MAARYTLLVPGRGIIDQWTDTPGRVIVQQLRRRARTGRLPPGAELRCGNRTVATWEQLR